MITLDNLTLVYDRHPAVHHVTARVEEGDLLAIVGPNGAPLGPTIANRSPSSTLAVT